MEAAPLGRRQRKKQAQRAKIVFDCCDLIGEYGVEGTTLEVLCERVDISRKTFYNYFESKDSLLLEICQGNLMAGIQALVDSALASDSGCAGQLDIIFTAMFEGQEGAQQFDLELIDYLVSNFARHRGASIGLLDEMNGHFARFFQAHEQSLRPGLSAQFCAEMTVGMLNSVILNWMNHPDASGPDKLPEVSAFIKHSMLAGESA